MAPMHLPIYNTKTKQKRALIPNKNNEDKGAKDDTCLLGKNTK
jgi:hypothetical protein